MKYSNMNNYDIFYKFLIVILIMFINNFILFELTKQFWVRKMSEWLRKVKNRSDVMFIR